MGEFNRLPELWIEDPETTLLDTFEAKFDTKNTCEYHIKPRGKDNLSIKYTYHDSVSISILKRLPMANLF